MVICNNMIIILDPPETYDLLMMDVTSQGLAVAQHFSLAFI